ncbi:hypothetical protein Acr_00g0002560 [Actinidia rufa]|uniref:Uncharacterized protein n=1 Tax=Actinidia rufa TaxID=165716 RepID=A0A7J0D6W2_9ERIC|nr:hypothetical protein Acr_00g0002560 [Actinidia rufa]
MLFAKKGQRAVLRLVELPAAGDFLRAPQEKKEGHSMEMFAFGMKMDEQALEPGTDEIRGKHGTGHYTGGGRDMTATLRFKYR